MSGSRLVDVAEVILGEHERCRTAFAQSDAAADADAQQREWQPLKDLLQVHAAALPTIRDRVDTDERARLGARFLEFASQQRHAQRLSGAKTDPDEHLAEHQ